MTSCYKWFLHTPNVVHPKLRVSFRTFEGCRDTPEYASRGKKLFTRCHHHIKKYSENRDFVTVVDVDERVNAKPRHHQRLVGDGLA